MTPYGVPGGCLSLSPTRHEARLEEYVELFDASFAGGVDVDPKYYGER